MPHTHNNASASQATRIRRSSCNCATSRPCYTTVTAFKPFSYKCFSTPTSKQRSSATIAIDSWTASLPPTCLPGPEGRDKHRDRRRQPLRCPGGGHQRRHRARARLTGRSREGLARLQGGADEATRRRCVEPLNTIVTRRGGPCRVARRPCRRCLKSRRGRCQLYNKSSA